MPLGKTPAEILSGFDDIWHKLYDVSVDEKMPQMLKEYVRQALADVVRWAAENMAMPSDYAMFIDKNGNRIRSSKDRLLALADQIDKEMTI